MTNVKLQSSGIWFLIIAVIVIAIDYLSKQWILTNIPYMGILNKYDVNLELGFFGIDNVLFKVIHVHNLGAAFSFLADQAGWQQIIFGVFAIGISLFLTFLLCKNTANKYVINSAYAFVIGGALGNLYDRVVYKFVVDFLDFSVIMKGVEHHYPAFNVADIAICVGIGIIAIYQIFFDKSTKKEEK